MEAFVLRTFSSSGFLIRLWASISSQALSWETFSKHFMIWTNTPIKIWLRNMNHLNSTKAHSSTRINLMASTTCQNPNSIKRIEQILISCPQLHSFLNKMVRAQVTCNWMTPFILACQNRRDSSAFRQVFRTLADQELQMIARSRQPKYLCTTEPQRRWSITTSNSLKTSKWA